LQIYAQEGSNCQSTYAYLLAQGKLFYRCQVGFAQGATVSLNLIGWQVIRYEEHNFLVITIQQQPHP
jgi:hypothetical protein